MSRLTIPIRRAIRRRPSPGTGSMGLPAVTAARGSAAAMERAWVRVQPGDWPVARAGSARAVSGCRLNHRRSPAGPWRPFAPTERELDELRH
jgi:hypothetical protein